MNWPLFALIQAAYTLTFIAVLLLADTSRFTPESLSFGLGFGLVISAVIGVSSRS